MLVVIIYEDVGNVLPSLWGLGFGACGRAMPEYCCLPGCLDRFCASCLRSQYSPLKVVSSAPTNVLHFVRSRHLMSKFSTAIPARNRQKSSNSKVRFSKKEPEDSILDADMQDFENSSYAEQIRATRQALFKACFTTCGGIAAAGFLIRQISRFLSGLGWLSSDCTRLMPYAFAPWHLGVAFGLVALVSALRYFLLKITRSQTGNPMFSCLEPWDCVAVSFASGVSEELLFRGALLPLLGLDSKGVIVTGIVFGALHLTGGRNAAYAIWASFVGVLYGAASVWTSNLLVPMLAHSLANLVAALLSKYSVTDQYPPPTEA